MRLVFKPSDHDKFLACLIRCFPGWGQKKMLDWCFARTATGPAPERMVFADEAGEWVAGTAISFRTMRVPELASEVDTLGAKRWLIGVMTGSWTLPAARGQGLFPRFIQETRARVIHHGGVAVVGFAGDIERASTRKLVAAGSRPVPSWQAIGCPLAAFAGSNVEAEAGLDVRATTTGDAELLYARYKRRAERGLGGFAYDDLASFAGQFVDRALPTCVVRADGDALGIVETAPEVAAIDASGTDRLLFLDESGADRATILRALRARASLAGRNVFAYGVGEEAAGVFDAAGFARKAGYLTILPANDSPEHAAICDMLAAIRWDFQSGDRM